MLSLQDKKNQDSLILSSLLASIGDCKFNMEISQTDIRDALLVYNKTLYKHQIERSE